MSMKNPGKKPVINGTEAYFIVQQFLETFPSMGKAAMALGVSPNCILGWKKGRTLPSVHSAKKIEIYTKGEIKASLFDREGFEEIKTARAVRSMRAIRKFMRFYPTISMAAQAAGVSPSAIISWKRGYAVPNERNARKIEEVTEGKVSAKLFR